MKKQVFIVTFLSLLFFLVYGGSAFAEGNNINIEKMVVCEKVVDRSPVGEASIFAASLGRVFCFTDVSLEEAPAEIFHVWYRKGKEMARVKLDIKGKTWRTWSSKRILPSWDGKWRVDVEDISGHVLGSKEFTVVNASENEQNVY